MVSWPQWTLLSVGGSCSSGLVWFSRPPALGSVGRKAFGVGVHVFLGRMGDGLVVLVGLGRWLMGCFGGGFWSSVFGLVCWSVFVSSVARLLAFASMCSWAVWVTSWWFWVVVYIRAVPEGMVEIADAILDNPETKKKPKPLQDWQRRSRQDLVLGWLPGKS